MVSLAQSIAQSSVGAAKGPDTESKISPVVEEMLADRVSQTVKALDAVVAKTGLYPIGNGPVMRSITKEELDALFKVGDVIDLDVFAGTSLENASIVSQIRTMMVAVDAYTDALVVYAGTPITHEEGLPAILNKTLADAVGLSVEEYLKAEAIGSFDGTALEGKAIEEVFTKDVVEGAYRRAYKTTQEMPRAAYSEFDGAGLMEAVVQSEMSVFTGGRRIPRNISFMIAGRFVSCMFGRVINNMIQKLVISALPADVCIDFEITRTLVWNLNVQRRTITIVEVNDPAKHRTFTTIPSVEEFIETYKSNKIDERIGGDTLSSMLDAIAAARSEDDYEGREETREKEQAGETLPADEKN